MRQGDRFLSREFINLVGISQKNYEFVKTHWQLLKNCLAGERGVMMLNKVIFQIWINSNLLYCFDQVLSFLAKFP